MTVLKACLAGLVAVALQAQVYSPRVLRAGEIDSTTLTALAQGICERAGAVTPRGKAEAIWRFFLTDGRFVTPGFWYHIAGWAYEEPDGEVLDPIKLLNSYGFGLCYQVAPLLEAVWEAAGLPARVWFLTGHTVAEVFYDGAYHHYDSDLMGYNTVGFKGSSVASVHQLEHKPAIMLGKLLSPTQADARLVDDPWYPGDLRAAAMKGLAELFSSTRDNWLFAFTRYPQSHSMDFVLRPGERMTRYFRPESPGLFHLPFQYDGRQWREFPREVARYGIRTEDGPRSQKDGRTWATGRLDYSPVLSDAAAYYAALSRNVRYGDRLTAPATAVFEVRSPYVIIDARVTLGASLAAGDSVEVSTSTDGGATWEPAGSLAGPHQGDGSAGARPLVKSEHGVLTAVSGTYGYLVKLAMLGSASVGPVTITTRFQLNPRTLPALEPGPNEVIYRSGAGERRHVALAPAFRMANLRHAEEGGQGFWRPRDNQPAELVYELAAPDGSAIGGFDAGGRFLDLRDGLAPDKFTAEVRKTSVRLAGKPSASLDWALSPDGKFEPLWAYEERVQWRDGEPIDRLLRWPEVDRQVRSLPPGTTKAYVRYRIAGMALDSIRLAVLAPAVVKPARLEITHLWRENGQEKRHVERIARPDREQRYVVKAGGAIINEAVVFDCPAKM